MAWPGGRLGRLVIMKRLMIKHCHSDGGSLHLTSPVYTRTCTAQSVVIDSEHYVISEAANVHVISKIAFIHVVYALYMFLHIQVQLYRGDRGKAGHLTFA